jgi:hypothetical protein
MFAQTISASADSPQGGPRKDRSMSSTPNPFAYTRAVAH